jgi:hypothetical protein
MNINKIFAFFASIYKFIVKARILIGYKELLLGIGTYEKNYTFLIKGYIINISFCFVILVIIIVFLLKLFPNLIDLNNIQSIIFPLSLSNLIKKIKSIFFNDIELYKKRDYTIIKTREGVVHTNKDSLLWDNNIHHSTLEMFDKKYTKAEAMIDYIKELNLLEDATNMDFLINKKLPPLPINNSLSD